MKYFLYTRPWYWLPAIFCGLGGLFYQSGSGNHLFEIFLIVLILGPGISSFAETYNDLCDIENDRRSLTYKLGGITLAGGSRYLIDGQISITSAKIISILSILIAIIPSLILGLYVLFLTVIGLLLSYLYSSPLFRGKEKPIIGQFLLGLGYGPISFCIGYYSINESLVFDSNVILIFLLLFLWMIITGLTADIIDYFDNIKTGIKNFVVILKRDNAIMLTSIGSLILLLVTFTLPIFNIFSIRINLIILITPIIILRIIFLFRARYSKRVLSATHILSILAESIYPLIFINL